MSTLRTELLHSLSNHNTRLHGPLNLEDHARHLIQILKEDIESKKKDLERRKNDEVNVVPIVEKYDEEYAKLLADKYTLLSKESGSDKIIYPESFKSEF